MLAQFPYSNDQPDRLFRGIEIKITAFQTETLSQYQPIVELSVSPITKGLLGVIVPGLSYQAGQVRGPVVTIGQLAQLLLQEV